MTMQLRKAERKQSRMRISAAGPSGSGKTYSMLLFARGMVDNWNDIALIDTESKRGDIYAELGDYNIITLEAPFSPERLLEALHVCEQSGAKVIVIDSASHEWDGPGGCLEINDKLAQTKFKGNTWAAWSETTPRHQKFIEGLIQSPCHVIVTMRSKTDTIQTEDKKIKKVGLKEIQREGFEYEMTVSFNIDRDTHYAMVGKDNTQLFGGDPFLITTEHGKKLREWNESGKPDPSIQLNWLKKAIVAETKRLEYPDMVKATAEYRQRITADTGLELTDANLEQILAKLKAAPIPDKAAEAAVMPDFPTQQTIPTAPVEPAQEPKTAPAGEIAAPDGQTPAAKEADEPDEATRAGAAAFDRAIEKKIGPAIISVIKNLLAQKYSIVRDNTEEQVNWISLYFEDVQVEKLEDITVAEGKRIVDHLSKIKQTKEA